MGWGNQRDFSELLGKTLTDIIRDDETILFFTDTGEKYVMQHHQDCCESVTIEDICGEFQDCIGSPINLAEEVTYQGEGSRYDSHTWTYYRLGTQKGDVSIRWFGTSNGYYSESVYFEIAGTEH